MNPLTSIVFLIFSLISRQAYSVPIKDALDMHQVGSWALSQHNSICNLLYNSLKEGLLKPKGKSYTDIENLFLDTLIKKDLKQGKIVIDTVVSLRASGYFQLNFADTIFQFKVKEGYEAIIIDQDLQALLNEEEKLYVCLFSKNGVLSLSAIPKQSQRLLGNMSIKLYNNAMDSNVNLYTNDSLKQSYGNGQKLQLGYKAYLRFKDWREWIGLDDPTICYDTEYIEPYWMVMDSFDNFIALSYLATMNDSGLDIDALGFGLTNYSRILEQTIWMPVGYIKTTDFSNADDKDRQALQTLIRWCIDRRLELYDIDLILYEEIYQIKEETPYILYPNSKRNYYFFKD